MAGGEQERPRDVNRVGTGHGAQGVCTRFTPNVCSSPGTTTHPGKDSAVWSQGEMTVSRVPWAEVVPRRPEALPPLTVAVVCRGEWGRSAQGTESRSAVKNWDLGTGGSSLRRL